MENHCLLYLAISSALFLEVLTGTNNRCLHECVTEQLNPAVCSCTGSTYNKHSTSVRTFVYISYLKRYVRCGRIYWTRTFVLESTNLTRFYVFLFKCPVFVFVCYMFIYWASKVSLCTKCFIHRNVMHGDQGGRPASLALAVSDVKWDKKS